MPLTGGEEVFVPEMASVANRYWDNSPQGIYFVAPYNTPALALFHFPGGEVTKVVNLPGNQPQSTVDLLFLPTVAVSSTCRRMSLRPI
jgi:hypothetical protein